MLGCSPHRVKSELPEIRIKIDDQSESMTCESKASMHLVEESGLQGNKVPPQSPQVTFKKVEKKTSEDMEITKLSIPINCDIRRCIDYYIKKRRSDLEKGIQLGKVYLPMIRKQLALRGMPQEFAWIPFVESQFDINARSQNHAVGMWQLMPVMAKKFGLRIDTWIDERKDPVRSTSIALDMLEYLHGKLGGWLLALAAYNAGEGRIFRAIKQLGTRDYWTLARKRTLPGQTIFYVSAVLAVDYIARHPEEFGVPSEKNLVMKPFECWITVPNQVSLIELAKCSQISIKTLLLLNPALKRSWTPPDYPGFRLFVLPEAIEKMEQCLNSMVWEEKCQWAVHEVKKGDTLFKLAKHYGSSIDAIMESNNLDNHIIFTGTKLIIPLEIGMQ